MSKETIVAYTKPGINYPGYINFTREGDNVAITLRGDPDGDKCGVTARLVLSANEWEKLRFETAAKGV